MDVGSVHDDDSFVLRGLHVLSPDDDVPLPLTFLHVQVLAVQLEHVMDDFVIVDDDYSRYVFYLPFHSFVLLCCVVVAVAVHVAVDVHVVVVVVAVHVAVVIDADDTVLVLVVVLRTVQLLAYHS